MGSKSRAKWTKMARNRPKGSLLSRKKRKKRQTVLTQEIPPQIPGPVADQNLDDSETILGRDSEIGSASDDNRRTFESFSLSGFSRKVADQNLDDLINETDSEDDDDEPRAKKSESKKFPDQLMEMEDGEVVDLSAAHETDSEDDDEIDSAPYVLLTKLRDKLRKYVRLFDEETQRSEIMRKKLKFYYEKFNDEKKKVGELEKQKASSKIEEPKPNFEEAE